MKNLAFSEGFDDFAEVRVTVTPVGVEVHTAAAEVGQGLVTLCQQIARIGAGDPSGGGGLRRHVVDRVGRVDLGVAADPDDRGGVESAATELRRMILDAHGGDDLDDAGVWRDGELVVPPRPPRQGRSGHPPRALPAPAHRRPRRDGQGDLHVDFAVAAHRAVVDVDIELGLLRVVAVDTVQDVGMVLNPAALLGQVEGGIMQGVGLAVMEELVLDHGVIRNASFTDYLLPTFADAPSVTAGFVEEPSHFGPFGAKGAGEPPTISSTAAIAAAIRDATGLAGDPGAGEPRRHSIGDRTAGGRMIGWTA